MDMNNEDDLDFWMHEQEQIRLEPELREPANYPKKHELDEDEIRDRDND